MSFIKRLKELDADIEFKKKHIEYQKLKWQRTKKQMIFDFADIPIVILTLISSVAISIWIYAYLFFEIIYPLTLDEFLPVFSNPTILLSIFCIVSLIPILVFAVVVSIVGVTIQHYEKRKELEKELKEDE